MEDTQGVEIEIDRIVEEIKKVFPTFGGGQTSDFNPVVNAMKNQPLMFAGTVDVKTVVTFVLSQFIPFMQEKL